MIQCLYSLALQNLTVSRSILIYFQRINEKPQVINDYEAGRAIPNNQILSKIERVIGNHIFVAKPWQSRMIIYSTIPRSIHAGFLIHWKHNSNNE